MRMAARREQLDLQRASWMQQRHETKAAAAAAPSRTSSASSVSAPAAVPAPGEAGDYDCPICTTLMAGAAHVPTVLFPCGHTFCRSCLDGGSGSERPKCPFCRQAIQSRAVNVPLQAMIERRRPNRGQSGDAAERYLSEFRALTMRKRALGAERGRIRARLDDADAERRRLAAAATRLASEQDRASAELARLQKELEGVVERRERNAEAMRRVDEERMKEETGLEQIEAQLRPIQVGIDKSRLLFYNFRPDAVLSSDDDDEG